MNVATCSAISRSPFHETRCRSLRVTMTRFWIIPLVITMATVSPCTQDTHAQNVMDLAGEWTFQLDADNVGIEERWYERTLRNSIHLPGSLQQQGYGHDVSVDTPWTGAIIDRSWFTADRYEKYRQPGNVKVPFWLQPKKHYVGAAWYQ